MANNRFTPDDLIAKGYVKTAGGWVLGLKRPLLEPAKAPIPPTMPKATPQPSKRRKTAPLPPAWAASTFATIAFGARCTIATPEHRFDPSRRWRFDYAFLPQKVAVEVQGGIWTNGRHTRGAALLKEWEKLNRAAELGWRILYVQPSDLCKPDFIAQVTRTLTPK